jgi:hypothetical protein
MECPGLIDQGYRSITARVVRASDVSLTLTHRERPALHSCVATAAIRVADVPIFLWTAVGHLPQQ